MNLRWEGGMYAAVETKYAVGLEDVDEGAEHAFRSIWSAGLEPDL